MIQECQEPKGKPWLRSIAILTCLIFTATSVVQADMIATLTSSSAKSNPEEKISVNPQAFLETIQLSDSIGQIKKSFQGSRDRVIIHIQDAHINEEAQRNIAGILDYFVSDHQLKWVSLEGAQGELYTDLFSFYPSQNARRTVSDYFLREGRLTGPEYLAIVNRPDLKLYGVEDKAIYDENRKAYLDALNFKNRDEEILAGLQKIMNRLSRYVFSEEMGELNRRRSSFQEGGRELAGYVHYLIDTAKKNNLALYDYPGMHSLISLVELEGEIDFDKAEQEIEGLTQDLKKILSREKLSRFLTNTVQFRMKKMKRGDYYGYLEDEIKNLPVTSTVATDTGGEAALREKYENVLKYLRYMKLYESINVEIFDEIEKLENVIKNKLFKSEVEVKLDRLMRMLDIYQKMFDFTLTKQDADFFYAYRDEFKAETFKQTLNPLLQKYHFTYQLPAQMDVLDEDLPKVEKFYNAALKRDHIMIEKAVEKMEKEDQKVMAIVTGGFHTPGIEKYLKEHDYSYMVISPRISKQMDTEREARLYENAMSQKPLPIEKTLVEAFMAPRPVAINDPRFQLVAWRMVVNREESGAEFLHKIGLGYENYADVQTFISKDPGFALAFFQSLLTGVENIFEAGDPKAAVHAMKEGLKNRISNESDRAVMEKMMDRVGNGIIEKKASGEMLYWFDGANPQEKMVVALVKTDRSEVAASFKNRPDVQRIPWKTGFDLMMARVPAELTPVSRVTTVESSASVAERSIINNRIASFETKFRNQLGTIKRSSLDPVSLESRLKTLQAQIRSEVRSISKLSGFDESAKRSLDSAVASIKEQGRNLLVAAQKREAAKAKQAAENATEKVEGLAIKTPTVVAPVVEARSEVRAEQQQASQETIIPLRQVFAIIALTAVVSVVLGAGLTSPLGLLGFLQASAGPIFVSLFAIAFGYHIATELDRPETLEGLKYLQSQVLPRLSRAVTGRIQKINNSMKEDKVYSLNFITKAVSLAVLTWSAVTMAVLAQPLTYLPQLWNGLLSVLAAVSVPTSVMPMLPLLGIGASVSIGIIALYYAAVFARQDAEKQIASKRELERLQLQSWADEKVESVGSEIYILIEQVSKQIDSRPFHLSSINRSLRSWKSLGSRLSRIRMNGNQLLHQKYQEQLRVLQDILKYQQAVAETKSVEQLGRIMNSLVVQDMPNELADLAVKLVNKAGDRFREMEAREKLAERAKIRKETAAKERNSQIQNFINTWKSRVVLAVTAIPNFIVQTLKNITAWWAGIQESRRQAVEAKREAERVVVLEKVFALLIEAGDLSVEMSLQQVGGLLNQVNDIFVASPIQLTEEENDFYRDYLGKANERYAVLYQAEEDQKKAEENQKVEEEKRQARLKELADLEKQLRQEGEEAQTMIGKKDEVPVRQSVDTTPLAGAPVATVSVGQSISLSQMEELVNKSDRASEDADEIVKFLLPSTRRERIPIQAIISELDGFRAGRLDVLKSFAQDLSAEEVKTQVEITKIQQPFILAELSVIERLIRQADDRKALLDRSTALKAELTQLATAVRSELRASWDDDLMDAFNEMSVAVDEAADTFEKIQREYEIGAAEDLIYAFEDNFVPKLDEILADLGRMESGEIKIDLRAVNSNVQVLGPAYEQGVKNLTEELNRLDRVNDSGTGELIPEVQVIMDQSSTQIKDKMREIRDRSTQLKDKVSVSAVTAEYKPVDFKVAKPAEEAPVPAVEEAAPAQPVIAQSPSRAPPVEKVDAAAAKEKWSWGKRFAIASFFGGLMLYAALLIVPFFQKTTAPSVTPVEAKYWLESEAKKAQKEIKLQLAPVTTKEAPEPEVSKPEEIEVEKQKSVPPVVDVPVDPQIAYRTQLFEGQEIPNLGDFREDPIRLFDFLNQKRGADKLGVLLSSDQYRAQLEKASKPKSVGVRHAEQRDYAASFNQGYHQIEREWIKGLRELGLPNAFAEGEGTYDPNYFTPFDWYVYFISPLIPKSAYTSYEDLNRRIVHNFVRHIEAAKQEFAESAKYAKQARERGKGKDITSKNFMPPYIWQQIQRLISPEEWEKHTKNPDMPTDGILGLALEFAIQEEAKLYSVPGRPTDYGSAYFTAIGSKLDKLQEALRYWRLYQARQLGLVKLDKRTETMMYDYFDNQSQSYAEYVDTYYSVISGYREQQFIPSPQHQFDQIRMAEMAIRGEYVPTRGEPQTIRDRSGRTLIVPFDFPDSDYQRASIYTPIYSRQVTPGFRQYRTSELDANYKMKLPVLERNFDVLRALNDVKGALAHREVTNAYQPGNRWFMIPYFDPHSPDWIETARQLYGVQHPYYNDWTPLRPAQYQGKSVPLNLAAFSERSIGAKVTGNMTVLQNLNNLPRDRESQSQIQRYYGPDLIAPGIVSMVGSIPTLWKHWKDPAQMQPEDVFDRELLIEYTYIMDDMWKKGVFKEIYKNDLSPYLLNFMHDVVVMGGVGAFERHENYDDSIHQLALGLRGHLEDMPQAERRALEPVIKEYFKVYGEYRAFVAQHGSILANPSQDPLYIQSEQAKADRKELLDRRNKEQKAAKEAERKYEYYRKHWNEWLPELNAQKQLVRVKGETRAKEWHQTWQRHKQEVEQLQRQYNALESKALLYGKGSTLKDNYTDSQGVIAQHVIKLTAMYYYIWPLLEISDARFSGLVSPADITDRALQKTKLIPVAEKYYGRKFHLLNADVKNPDGGIITALIDDMYSRKMDLEVYAAIMARAMEPEVQKQALKIYHLIIGDESVKTLDYRNNPVHDSTLRWWAKESRVPDAYDRWSSVFADQKKRETLIQYASQMRAIFGKGTFSASDLVKLDKNDDRVGFIIAEAEDAINKILLTRSVEADWDVLLERGWENWTRGRLETIQRLEKIKQDAVENKDWQPSEESTKRSELRIETKKLFTSLALTGAFFLGESRSIAEVQLDKGTMTVAQREEDFNSMRDVFYILQAFEKRTLQGPGFEADYREFIKLLQNDPEARGWVVSWTASLEENGFDFSKDQQRGIGRKVAELLVETPLADIVQKANHFWESFDTGMGSTKALEITTDIHNLDRVSRGRFMSVLQQAGLEGWVDWVAKENKMSEYLADPEKVNTAMDLSREFYMTVLGVQLPEFNRVLVRDQANVRRYFLSFLGIIAGEQGDAETAWNTGIKNIESLIGLFRDEEKRDEIIRDAFTLDSSFEGKSVDFNQKDTQERFQKYLKELEGSPTAQGSVISWALTRNQLGWDLTKGYAEKMARVLLIPGIKDAVLKNAEAVYGRKADLDRAKDRGVLYGLVGAIVVSYGNAIDGEVISQDISNKIIEKIEEMTHLLPRLIQRNDQDKSLKASKIGQLYKGLTGAELTEDNQHGLSWLSGEAGYMVGLNGRDQSDIGIREAWNTLETREKRDEHWRKIVDQRHQKLEMAADQQNLKELEQLLQLISLKPDRTLDFIGNKVDYGFLMTWTQDKIDLGWESDSDDAKNLFARTEHIMASRAFAAYLKELGIVDDFRKDLAESFQALTNKAEALKFDEKLVQRFYVLMGQISFYTKYAPAEFDQKIQENLTTIRALNQYYGSPAQTKTALAELFKKLQFKTVGRIDGMSANNYYDLRELMYLLAENERYRQQHQLTSGTPIPANVEKQLKENFKTVFVETLIAGFSKMIAADRSRPIDQVVEEYTRILKAFSPALNNPQNVYPIHMETKDPGTVSDFQDFIEKIKADGIHFDEKNKSMSIYREVFNQYQVMGLAGWWFERTSPDATEPLTIDEVIHRIQIKKKLWGFYNKYWNTDSLKVPIISAEISFLEGLGLSESEYEKFFKVGAVFQDWAKRSQGRHLYVDQLVYWYFSPGMYFQEERMLLRGGLSRLGVPKAIAYMLGYRGTDLYRLEINAVEGWRMFRTQTVILPTDPEQNKYHLAMDEEIEIKRFIRWHGQKQLLRILNEDEFNYWLKIYDSIKIPTQAEPKTLGQLIDEQGSVSDEQMARHAELMKELFLLGQIISQEVRRISLAGELPYTQEMFKNEDNQKKYIILRLLSRRDARRLTNREVNPDMTPEKMIDHVLAEARHIGIPNPELWIDSIKQVLKDNHHSIPDELGLKRLIKTILLDAESIVEEVEREFGYRMNPEMVLDFVVEQRADGQLNKILEAERKITEHYINVFSDPSKDVQLLGNESYAAPSVLIDQWIKEYGLQGTVIDQRREKWSLLLKDRSMTRRKVKSVFSDLHTLLEVWKSQDFVRNQDTDSTLINDLLILISKERRLGLEQYDLVDALPTLQKAKENLAKAIEAGDRSRTAELQYQLDLLEYRRSEDYKQTKKTVEDMMSADLGADAINEVYILNTKKQKESEIKAITNEGEQREYIQKIEAEAVGEIEINKSAEEAEIAWSLANKLLAALASFFVLLTLRAHSLAFKQRKDREHADPSKTTIRYEGDGTVSDRIAVPKKIFESLSEKGVAFGSGALSMAGAALAAVQVTPLLTFAGLAALVLAPISYFGYYLLMARRGITVEQGETVTKGFSPLHLPNIAYFLAVFGIASLMGTLYIIAHLMGTSNAYFSTAMIFFFTYLSITIGHIIIDRPISIYARKQSEKKKIIEAAEGMDELQVEIAQLETQLDELNREIQSRSELRQNPFLGFSLRRLNSEKNQLQTQLEIKKNQLREKQILDRLEKMTMEEKNGLGVPDGLQMPVFIITQAAGDGFNGVQKNLQKSLVGNPGRNIPGIIMNTGAFGDDETLKQAIKQHEMSLKEGRRTYYFRRAMPFTAEGINEGKKLLAFTEYQRFTGDGVMVPEVDAEKVTSRNLPYEAFLRTGILGALPTLIAGLVFGGYVGVAVYAVLMFASYWMGLWNYGGASREITRTKKGKVKQDRPVSSVTKGQIASMDVVYGDLSELGFVGIDGENQAIVKSGPKIYVSSAAKERYVEMLKKEGVISADADISDIDIVKNYKEKGVDIVFDYDQRVRFDRNSPKRIWGDYILDDKNVVGMTKKDAIRWFAGKYGIETAGKTDEQVIREIAEYKAYEAGTPHDEVDKVVSLIADHFERIISGDTRFDDALKEISHISIEIPAVHSVRNAALEMARNPWATLGQPIYVLSGATETKFTQMNADAAIIGAFYAEASLFYSRARGNFTGKGPVIKDSWLHGVKEESQRISLAFLKGSSAGTLFGAAIGVGTGLTSIGFFMFVGFFLGAIVLGNFEKRFYGGAFGVLYHNELSHDYAEGSAAGALNLKSSMVDEGATKNLKDQMTRQQSRWFQGVIPYWRHQLGPGVTLLDRWQMFLAQKMYLNDMILLMWFLGGIIAVTFSGLADRIVPVPRLQEFSTYLTGSNLLSSYLPFTVSPALLASAVVSLLVVGMVIAYLRGEQRPDGRILINLNKAIMNIMLSAFSWTVVFALTSVPLVMALFFTSVPLMIYFAIFTGAQKGDPAGYADWRKRVRLLFESTMIALQLPQQTLKHFLENFVRVMAGGVVPRMAIEDKAAFDNFKKQSAIVAVAGTSVAMASLLFLPPALINVALIAIIAIFHVALPHVIHRSSGLYIPIAWMTLGLGLTSMIIAIPALWFTPLLATLGNAAWAFVLPHLPVWLFNFVSPVVIFLSSGSAMSIVSLVAFKLYLSMRMSEWIAKYISILKEALPWNSFSQVASASTTLSLLDAARLTFGSFVLTVLTVIGGVIPAWSHFWVLIWGVSLYASWSLGWINVWYTSKPLLWDADWTRERYIEWVNAAVDVKFNNKVYTQEEAEILLQEAEQRSADPAYVQKQENQEDAFNRYLRENHPAKTAFLALDNLQGVTVKVPSSFYYSLIAAIPVVGVSVAAAVTATLNIPVLIGGLGFSLILGIAAQNIFGYEIHFKWGKFEIDLELPKVNLRLSFSESLFKFYFGFLGIPFGIISLVFLIPSGNLPAMAFGLATVLGVSSLMSFLSASLSRRGAPSVIRSLWKIVLNDFNESWNAVIARSKIYAIHSQLKKANKADLIDPTYLAVLKQDAVSKVITSLSPWQKVDDVKTVGDLRNLVASSSYKTTAFHYQAEFLANTIYMSGVAFGFGLIGAVLIGGPLFQIFGFDTQTLPDLNAFYFGFFISYLPAVVASFILPGTVGHLLRLVFLPTSFLARTFNAIQKLVDELALIDQKGKDRGFYLVDVPVVKIGFVESSNLGAFLRSLTMISIVGIFTFIITGVFTAGWSGLGILLVSISTVNLTALQMVRYRALKRSIDMIDQSKQPKDASRAKKAVSEKSKFAMTSKHLTVGSLVSVAVLAGAEFFKNYKFEQKPEESAKVVVVVPEQKKEEKKSQVPVESKREVAQVPQRPVAPKTAPEVEQEIKQTVTAPVAPAKNNLLAQHPLIAESYQDTQEGLLKLRAANGAPFNQTQGTFVPQNGWIKSADFGFAWTSDILMAANHQNHPIGKNSDPKVVTERIRKSLKLFERAVNDFELKVNGKGTGILPEILEHSNGYFITQAQGLPGKPNERGIVYSSYDKGLTDERLEVVEAVFKGGLVEGLQDNEIALMARRLLNRTTYQHFVDEQGKLHMQILQTPDGQIVRSGSHIDNLNTEARLFISIQELFGYPHQSMERRLLAGEDVLSKMRLDWTYKAVGNELLPILKGDFDMSAWTEYEGGQFYDLGQLSPQSLGVSNRNYLIAAETIAKQKGYPVFGTAPGTGKGIHEYKAFGLNDASVTVPVGPFLLLTSGEPSAVRNVETLIEKAQTQGGYVKGWGLSDAYDPKTLRPYNDKRIFMNQALLVEAANYELLREWQKATNGYGEQIKTYQELYEKSAPSVKKKQEVVKAREGLDLLTKFIASGAFTQIDKFPGNSAQMRNGKLFIEYHLQDGNHYAGFYGNMDPTHLNGYSYLRIRLGDKGVLPNKFKVELKSKGKTVGEQVYTKENLKLGEIIDLDVSIIAIQDRMIDEIAIVFEDHSVGSNKTGDFSIEQMELITSKSKTEKKSRSELREAQAPVTDLSKALDATQEQRTSIQSLVNVSAEAVEFSMVLDRVLASDEMMAELGVRLPAADARNQGLVIMNYDVTDTTADFVNRVHQQVLGLKDGVKLVIIRDANTSNEAWTALTRSELRYSNRISFAEVGVGAVSSYVESQASRLGIPRELITQVVGVKGLKSQAERQFAEQAEISAVKLSEGTVILLGFEQKVTSGIQTLMIQALLSKVFAELQAQEATAVSA